MNFNIGGPSNTEFGNSSSSESEDEVMEVPNMGLSEEEIVCRIIQNNNRIMQLALMLHNTEPVHGGSIPGHRVINRDREAADRNLWNDYFSDNPRYNANMFRRRYRMSRSLFLRIVEAVHNHDLYFHQKKDGVGRIGLSPLQKITAAFRMLAYGLPADATDEYVKIRESTAIESLKKFCHAIVEIFQDNIFDLPMPIILQGYSTLESNGVFLECWAV